MGLWTEQYVRVRKPFSSGGIKRNRAGLEAEEGKGAM